MKYITNSIPFYCCLKNKEINIDLKIAINLENSSVLIFLIDN